VDFECDLNPVFYFIPKSTNSYHRLVITKILTANTLTINSGITVSATKFTSQALLSNSGGGIVAIVANKIVMNSNSKITADGAGFSGGALENQSPPCVGCPLCKHTNYLCGATGNRGAQRGASIAPYSEDITVRKYCRGALANGGGGGNNHNAPGGGGSNVCSNANTLLWTGDGGICHFPNIISFSI